MASPTYPAANGSFGTSSAGSIPDKRRAHCPRCGAELGGITPVLCHGCIDGIDIIRCARWACPPINVPR